MVFLAFFPNKTRKDREEMRALRPWTIGLSFRSPETQTMVWVSPFPGKYRVWGGLGFGQSFSRTMVWVSSREVRNTWVGVDEWALKSGCRKRSAAKGVRSLFSFSGLFRSLFGHFFWCFCHFFRHFFGKLLLPDSFGGNVMKSPLNRKLRGFSLFLGSRKGT